VPLSASGERIIDTLFSKLRSGRYEFDKKRFRTHYAKPAVSHLVGSAGKVVHSSASGARNVNALFFMLGGTGTDSRKIVMGHVMMNFCFCIRWDLHVM
jgi:hypothetical protein